MIIDHAQRLNSLKTRLFRLDDLRRALLRRKFKNEIRLLSNFIPAGTFVADVGAHHGRMTRELAVVHHGACRVLAFEPVVYNQMVAKAVLRWYSNVRLFPIGLSDSEMETEILMAMRSNGAWVHGAASVTDHSGDDPQGSPEVYVSNVATLRVMDDVLDEAGVDRLGFMKIDVEGHEQSVLKGAAKTLERDRPAIMIEVRPADSDSITLLGDIGYRFYNLDRRDSGRWERSSTAAVESLFGGHNDILCWHPGERESTPPAFVGAFDGTRFG